MSGDYVCRSSLAMRRNEARQTYKGAIDAALRRDLPATFRAYSTNFSTPNREIPRIVATFGLSGAGDQFADSTGILQHARPFRKMGDFLVD